MAPVTPEALLNHLEWRYAVKKFDSSRTIAADTWDALEKALVLSPSSFGLQPWKFLVITDQATKEILKPVSWNQEQITSCSHLVVFTIKKDVGKQHIEQYINQIAKVRNVPVESLNAYKEMMNGSIAEGPIKPIVNQWAARQLYIALGVFLSAAAALEVDTCPMEGFDAGKYDEILGLSAKGLTAVAICPAGYRADDDKYSQIPKVRFDRSDVIEHI